MSLRDWRRSLEKNEPITVVLKESHNASKQEIWWGIRLYDDVATITSEVRLDHKYRNEKSIPNEDSEIKERVYYVYVSPSSVRQHTWNVETDEPNFVYSCHGDDVEVLVQRTGIYRDDNNRLMPPDWRPPSEPWYSYFIDPVIFACFIIVGIGGMVYFGQRYRKLRSS